MDWMLNVFFLADKALLILLTFLILYESRLPSAIETDVAISKLDILNKLLCHWGFEFGREKLIRLQNKTKPKTQEFAIYISRAMGKKFGN